MPDGEARVTLDEITESAASGVLRALAARAAATEDAGDPADGLSGFLDRHGFFVQVVVVTGAVGPQIPPFGGIGGATIGGSPDPRG